MVLVGRDRWSGVNDYSSILTRLCGDTSLDIVEVWSRPDYVVPLDVNFFDLSICNRRLLWKRREPKKMTVAEIEAVLGHPVEIVSEAEVM